MGNNEQHVASNKQRAVGYEKQNDSEKQRTKQREASSEKLTANSIEVAASSEL